MNETKSPETANSTTATPTTHSDYRDAKSHSVSETISTTANTPLARQVVRTSRIAGVISGFIACAPASNPHNTKSTTTR